MKVTFEAVKDAINLAKHVVSLPDLNGKRQWFALTGAGTIASPGGWPLGYIGLRIMFVMFCCPLI